MTAYKKVSLKLRNIHVTTLTKYFLFFNKKLNSSKKVIYRVLDFLFIMSYQNLNLSYSAEKVDSKNLNLFAISFYYFFLHIQLRLIYLLKTSGFSPNSIRNPKILRKFVFLSSPHVNKKSKDRFILTVHNLTFFFFFFHLQKKHFSKFHLVLPPGSSGRLNIEYVFAKKKGFQIK